eukprot:1195336-Prorocentrum_minimum.AAC.7
MRANARIHLQVGGVGRVPAAHDEHNVGLLLHDFVHRILRDGRNKTRFTGIRHTAAPLSNGAASSRILARPHTRHLYQATQTTLRLSPRSEASRRRRE